MKISVPYALLVLLTLTALLGGCSKLGKDVNPSQKDPASLARNTMEIRYDGENYGLSQPANPSQKFFQTDFPYHPLLTFGSGFDWTKEPYNNLLVWFQCPAPTTLPQSYPLTYGSVVGSVSLDYAKHTLVTFFWQLGRSPHTRVSMHTGLIQTSSGTLTITRYEPNKVLQGRFSFIMADKTDRVEVEGVFNYSI